jgi:hypothetical protein
MTIPLSSSSSTVDSSGSSSHRSKVPGSSKLAAHKRHSQTKLHTVGTPTSSKSIVEGSGIPGICLVPSSPLDLLESRRFSLPPRETATGCDPTDCESEGGFSGPGLARNFAFTAGQGPPAPFHPCESESTFPTREMFAPKGTTSLGISMPNNPLVQRMLQRRHEQQQEPKVAARSDLPPSKPAKRESSHCFQTLSIGEGNHKQSLAPGINDSFPLESVYRGYFAGTIGHSRDEDVDKATYHGSNGLLPHEQYKYDLSGDDTREIRWSGGESPTRTTSRTTGDSYSGLQTDPTATIPLTSVLCLQAHARSNYAKATQPLLDNVLLHETSSPDSKPRQPKRLESQVSLQNAKSAPGTSVSDRRSTILPQSLLSAKRDERPANVPGMAVHCDTPLRQPVRVNTQIAMSASRAIFQGNGPPQGLQNSSLNATFSDFSEDACSVASTVNGAHA